jgi:hypothetical protein
MNRDAYLSLMQFPKEWTDWEMVPGLFVDLQSAQYEPGHEDGSEHDRHGVFQWWLKQNPTAEQLVLLARLSWIDPDPLMAGYVRECIQAQPNFSAAVADAISTPYHRT